MPKKKKPNPVGRPSKRASISLDKIIKLCLAGCTNIQIAIACDVSEKTIYTYKKNDKEFLQTLKTNDKLADALVSRSLWERATGYSHPEDKIFCTDGRVTVVPTTKHYPPDPVSMIFWLKNRQPKKWRDRHDVEHSLDDDTKNLLTNALDRLQKNENSNS